MEDTLKKKISRVKGVKEVHILYGEYDMIVTLEAVDPTSLGRIVVEKIRHMAGIKYTRTHIVIKE